jgi:deoxyadenosine/deoxycytidine kinase
MNSHPYIAIEGPIGVGKTTLARLLQPELGASLLLEVFEENPFLKDFYRDRERYAFQTQIFFLLSRYHQQHKAIPKALDKGPLISDYTFAKDRIFAHLNLRTDELTLYEQLHAAMAEKIPVPAVVIYLRATLAALMERIATRDRPYERNMDRDYISELSRAYEQFFDHYTQTPVLTLDTDDLNYVRNPDDLNAVLDKVRGALRRVPYQQPLIEFS